MSFHSDRLTESEDSKSLISTDSHEQLISLVDLPVTSHSSLFLGILHYQ